MKAGVGVERSRIIQYSYCVIVLRCCGMSGIAGPRAGRCLCSPRIKSEKALKCYRAHQEFLGGGVGEETLLQKGPSPTKAFQFENSVALEGV